MKNFILAAFLLISTSGLTTATASDQKAQSIDKIDMRPFKTRILSNQEMIFIERNKSSSERVDKIVQSDAVFTPWSNIIRSKTKP